MTQRLYLQKTPKEDREKNEKLPYFRLVLIPEEEGGEWLNIGAFWVAKNGNGYTGHLDEKAVLDASAIEPYKKPEKANEDD
jgi:hypothetical protein